MFTLPGTTIVNTSTLGNIVNHKQYARIPIYFFLYHLSFFL